MWRRHSCLPCRDSSRHLFAVETKASVGRSADAAGRSACGAATIEGKASGLKSIDLLFQDAVMKLK